MLKDKKRYGENPFKKLIKKGKDFIKNQYESGNLHAWATIANQAINPNIGMRYAT